MRVRRYLRNVWGKCWYSGHTAMIDNHTPDLIVELETFRKYPDSFAANQFPQDHIPPGAA